MDNVHTMMANGKRLRSARCGVCAGCNSGDCGECKNCLDKPKFGGPGCRKQACMMRTCAMPRMVDENGEGAGYEFAHGSDESDDDECTSHGADAPESLSGQISEQISPTIAEIGAGIAREAVAEERDPARPQGQEGSEADEDPASASPKPAPAPSPNFASPSERMETPSAGEAEGEKAKFDGRYDMAASTVYNAIGRTISAEVC